MSIKRVEVANIGPVTLQKRRGTRSVRIHIQGSEVKVTLPYWVSHQQALDFVAKRATWIRQNLSEPSFITHGTIIGKQHRFLLQPSATDTLRSRIKNGVIAVSAPSITQVAEPTVQLKLNRMAERALKKECEALLAPRISDLAIENDFEFRSLHFKKLKTRWGSCDHRSNITINIFLIQLPWPLIDYLLVHELAHTKHHDHSASFWQEVEAVLPDYKQRRKMLKNFHPTLMTD